jgi:hypothetical protein
MAASQKELSSMELVIYAYNFLYKLRNWITQAFGKKDKIDYSVLHNLILKL